MYFSVPEAATIVGAGRGFVATKLGNHGVFALGGPFEARGRLRYIDGCSDSLLLAPCVFGDPCLNLLHLPPAVTQTAHTHPSLRVGLVARGSGWCDSGGRTHTLAPGSLFDIPPHCEHRFRTAAADMSVIAFHPDSAFGPSDEAHPMLDRTLLRQP